MYTVPDNHLLHGAKFPKDAPQRRLVLVVPFAFVGSVPAIDADAADVYLVAVTSRSCAPRRRP